LDLNANERATLMLASCDSEGRVWMTKSNTGELVAFGAGDTPEIPLGVEGKASLIDKELLLWSGASSCILTQAGWKAIDKIPPQTAR